MEFVDGRGSRAADRARRRAVDDALAVALQIACGLEAAHERGIVHRDLKPANVRITPDGTVKVLDFGLAKVDRSGRHRERGAVRRRRTRRRSRRRRRAMGMILGTAAYMAPEQARGKPVDKRADIWAFGCVVYEMLTAKRPFGGETVTDTLAAIVKEDPDWTALPAATPPRAARAARALPGQGSEAAAARHRRRAHRARAASSPARRTDCRAVAAGAPCAAARSRCSRRRSRSPLVALAGEPR